VRKTTGAMTVSEANAVGDRSWLGLYAGSSVGDDVEHCTVLYSLPPMSYYRTGWTSLRL